MTRKTFVKFVHLIYQTPPKISGMDTKLSKMVCTSDIMVESLNLPCCFFCLSYLSTLWEIKMTIFNSRRWNLFVSFQELQQVVPHESCNLVPLIKSHIALLSFETCSVRIWFNHTS